MNDDNRQIVNYDELEFSKKTLAPRDFNDKLYGLQEIPGIPELGTQVIVVDCTDGKEYPTQIQEKQYLISTGLKYIWDKFNRRNKLKAGDFIAIALDKENNHKIYVDFEYKERPGNHEIKDQEIDNKNYNDGELKMENDNKQLIDITIYDVLLAEKNIIIRGPPGTGKTFDAIKVAERVAKNGNNKEKLDKLKDEGYINVVTFHDAYGYEAFIEGITFYTEDENIPTESLQPMCKAGTFKAMCKKALLSAIKFEKVTDFIKLNKKGLRRTDEVIEDLHNNKIDFTWNDVYEEYLKAKSEGRVDFESAQKFVLIIDEINRGDIQKIFGDIITIIEKNKRLGAEEALTVELPNSRDIFGVPLNIYVIGTMNMSDRSISQLDAALGRRFGSINKKTDFSVIDNYINEYVKDEGTALGISSSKNAIEKINERMCDEYAIGRDRQIGHSYLLGIKNEKELIISWKYKILPQIEDFCAGNTDKMNKILFKKEEDSDWIKKKEGILGFKGSLDFMMFIQKIKDC